MRTSWSGLFESIIPREARRAVSGDPDGCVQAQQQKWWQLWLSEEKQPHSCWRSAFCAQCLENAWNRDTPRQRSESILILLYDAAGRFKLVICSAWSIEQLRQCSGARGRIGREDEKWIQHTKASRRTKWNVIRHHNVKIYQAYLHIIVPPCTV